MVKPPFSVRQNPERQEKFVALRKGIPDGLRPSLLKWTMFQYTGVEQVISLGVYEHQVGLLERLTDITVLPDDHRNSPLWLKSALSSDDELHLDAVDVALRSANRSEAWELETYLRDARSAYRVKSYEEDKYELQDRQSEEMSQLIDNEANQPGKAASHLRAAWSKCFGRKPQTNEACFEAVKAIEIAAKPVITPNDQNATLGKMRSAIRAKPEKWETDSDFDGSVETVLAMMDMVWEGHLRHGDESAPLEVSQEAAEMTVQTAVLLVSWFRSGRIRLRSNVSTDSKNIK